MITPYAVSSCPSRLRNLPVQAIIEDFESKPNDKKNQDVQRETSRDETGLGQFFLCENWIIEKSADVRMDFDCSRADQHPGGGPQAKFDDVSNFESN